ncbi:hypothetical protein [Roseinatronobacter alkalisoli]|uniref:Uncharacterized protein n=1 Tax=Roseinatronobacter alkalisoli TaxID=3028235 RepID=A0ABT5TG97_9RHOB|nr:hypothetical protein [Roseinatronobacter sp. HJB301]MDD7973396.1 hypothetical protein [Roseinatronobacter sp. HJB301]
MIFVNQALRPIVARLNGQPLDQTELNRSYRVEIICKGSQEAYVRALML